MWWKLKGVMTTESVRKKRRSHARTIVVSVGTYTYLEQNGRLREEQQQHGLESMGRDEESLVATSY